MECPSFFAVTWQWMNWKWFKRISTVTESYQAIHIPPENPQASTQWELGNPKVEMTVSALRPLIRGSIKTTMLGGSCSFGRSLLGAACLAIIAR
ncbi:hypothetical protein V6N13_053174 [Hibiscus sabdariffa]